MSHDSKESHRGLATQRQLAALRTISGVVVAVTALALLRHYKRHTLYPGPPVMKQNQDLNEHKDAGSRPTDGNKPKRTIVHNTINMLILLAAFLSVWRFGSLSKSVGLAILVGWIVVYGGWSLWASHWTDRTVLLQRLRDVFLFGALAALATQRIASTDDLQVRALLVFLIIAAVGFRLWHTEMYLASSKAGLGAALLGGVLVASTIFYVERASEQRSQQHQLRFTVGLQRDLSAADLVDEDLSYAHFYRKKLQDADLRGANLTGAFLVGTNLTGAWLSDALLTDSDLTDAVVKEAILSGATLDGAYIEGTNFQDSDLRGPRMTT